MKPMALQRFIKNTFGRLVAGKRADIVNFYHFSDPVPEQQDSLQFVSFAMEDRIQLIFGPQMRKSWRRQVFVRSKFSVGNKFRIIRRAYVITVLLTRCEQMSRYQKNRETIFHA